MSRITTFLPMVFSLLLSLAGCGGADDQSCPGGVCDLDAVAADADPGVSCSTSSPPDGGALYHGMTVYPQRCGSNAQCDVPICWVCGGETATWSVIGNEACARR
jgi:hypothetical protein